MTVKEQQIDMDNNFFKIWVRSNLNQRYFFFFRKFLELNRVF